MGLSLEFAANTLIAVKDREKKAYLVATQLEAFLDWAIASATKETLPSQTTDTKFYKTDETFHENGMHVLCFSAQEGENDSELKIEITSGGKVSLFATGIPFAAEANRESHFDLDTYTAEHAVAKILTLIEYDDVENFGPLVREAAKRYWVQELGWLKTKAPSYEPSVPAFGN